MDGELIYLEGGPCDGQTITHGGGARHSMVAHPTQKFTKEDSERIYQKASFYRHNYDHSREWDGRKIFTYTGTEVVF